tara:strand:+ start:2380 stop:2796 length:417 start_codon:yes stop_codon:yes gene_type:complete
MISFVVMNKETPRQKKVASVIQKELASLLHKYIRKEGASGLIVSITRVHITIDFAYSKIFLSIFPSEYASEQLSNFQENSIKIKHELSQVMKNQIRKVPKLTFYIDDSLDYIENIDSALKNRENPILNIDQNKPKQTK